jgi:hypothetical protein
MDKRSFIVGIFFFLLCLLQVNPSENIASPQVIAQRGLVARDCIVTVQGDFSQDKMLTWLNPRLLSVGRGDKVTRINESENDVKIRFGKGEPCRPVSLKALGWNLEPGKCHVTKDTLKFRESATIRFRDVGLYSYEIEFVD